jgi:hypothetical protein
MATFNLLITKIADNRNISERDEVWSTVAFAQKEALTCVAPSLKIGWIGAVLDEADNMILNLEEVPAYHCTWSAAVTTRYG